MAKLKLMILGKDDDVLRAHCRPVDQITDRIIRLLDDMTETMRANNGCGLAANQVGVLRRVVVIEVEEGNVIELINPKIVAMAGEQHESEGCLSLPGRWGITTRPKSVTVRALNRKGEEFEITGQDLLARAFCHELDHLDGKMFSDNAEMIDQDKESRGGN